MITIDQLLESVDLDFEPRWVTKDKEGEITIFSHRPIPEDWCSEWREGEGDYKTFGELKLSEFADKYWTECIYEVPRKTAGKIGKFDSNAIDILYDSNPEKFKKFICGEIVCKLNEVIDAVDKHADIIQQIGDWGARKGECLWCETLTKFEPSELKGVKNE